MRNIGINKRSKRRLLLRVSFISLPLLSAVVIWLFLLKDGSGSLKSAAIDIIPENTEAEANHEYSNHLVGETSPYLLMHAHNPVNWYPWGPEALAEARRLDRPIFLSVGYSTCYWCQVMERESFIDVDVARIINDNYIAIKVDREQRPDIDEQYMLATQMITQRGGWPNSIWLTPDGRPWMSGTYFPKDQFIQILSQLSEVWETRRSEVESQADQIAKAISRIGTEGYNAATVLNAKLEPALIENAANDYRRRFDPKNGGFGSAPKFPPHDALNVLFAIYETEQDPQILRMITRTLDAMWLGGIHDHVGGGFHRYATDDIWLLPHFEKMLYDNAQLISSFTDGYLLTKEQRYLDAVDEIFDWVQKQMTDKGGGFYSAINAEVDGEEGATYVWRYDDIMNVLGKEDGTRFAEIYNMKPEGNFREQRTGRLTGYNIPHLTEAIEKTASRSGLDAHALKLKLSIQKRKLLSERMTLEQPHIDDKVLTGWNGLMIAGFAYAGRKLDDERYTQLAERAAQFLIENMFVEGRLHRSYREGEVKIPAYLDGYAFFALGLLELYQATTDSTYLRTAQRLASVILSEFQDTENGGFYFTSQSAHENLIVRSKSLTGGGNIPNANGVAAQVLLRLSDLTGEKKYRLAAERTLKALAGLVQSSPTSLGSVTTAMVHWFSPSNLKIESLASTNAGGSNRDQLQTKQNQECPDYEVERGPVIVRAYLSSKKVSPGESLRLAVGLDISEGWHTYGRNPDIEFLIPTSVELRHRQDIEIAEIHSPVPHIISDPFLHEDIRSFTGTVWFVSEIRVESDAPTGEFPLELNVQFQACDEKRCLPPETINFQLDLTISDSSGRYEPRFSSIFSQFETE